jgi:hypothetical protein
MWNDPEKLALLGKKFGDMPGGMGNMIPGLGGVAAGGAGARGAAAAAAGGGDEGAGDDENDDEDEEEVESELIKAAMDGDVDTVQAMIKEGGPGARARVHSSSASLAAVCFLFWVFAAVGRRPRSGAGVQSQRG